MERLNSETPFLRLMYRFPLLYDLTIAAAGFKRVWQGLLEVLALQPGHSYLDVCCGTGTLALLAAERVGERGEVYGVDRSPHMLARARTKGRGHPVTFLLGSAEQLPFPDERFDRATVSMALHEMPRPSRARVLAEVCRVTRAEARAAFVEPGGGGMERLIAGVVEPRSILEMGGLVSELEENGLSVLEHQVLRWGLQRIVCTPTPTPTLVRPPDIPHTGEGRTQCLLCHGEGLAGASQVPPEHVGWTNEMCQACHKSG